MNYHSATIKPIIEENQLAKYNRLIRRRGGERSETNFPLKQAKIRPRYNLTDQTKTKPNFNWSALTVCERVLPYFLWYRELGLRVHIGEVKVKQDTNQDCKIVENQFTINPTQLSINVKFEMFNWNNSFNLTPSLSIGWKIETRRSTSESLPLACRLLSLF